MCEKHFPKPMTETTHFNDRGYPIYRHSTPESSKVVPHNRLLLELWDGHVNVEFAGYVFLVLYLYKYIFKGPDKARVEVHEGGDDGQREDDREIGRASGRERVVQYVELSVVADSIKKKKKQPSSVREL